MKSTFAITFATAALILTGPVFAQTSQNNTSQDQGGDEVGEFRDVYVDGEGDSVMLRGGRFGEGTAILGDTTYARPADCPEGSYYWSAENRVTACAEGGGSFNVVELETGTMMSTGQAFPTGARRMVPFDNSDNAQDTNRNNSSGNSGAAGVSGNSN